MASLSSLPTKALEGIFLCLDAEAAFTAFIYLSKRCFRVILNPDLRSQYMKLQFSLKHDYQPGLAAFQRVFSRESRSKWVPLTALWTTGGVDNDLHLWAQNMFFPGHHSAYSSREHRNNIVVAAVLSDLVQGPKTAAQIEAKNLVSGLIRGSWRLRGIPALLPRDSEEELTESEVAVAKELIRHNPSALVPWQLDENSAGRKMWLKKHLAQVKKAVSLLREEFSYRESEISSKEDYFMQLKCDVQAISQVKTLFFIRNLVISRSGEWTCPVKTFVIGISEDILEAESEELTKFNDLLRITDLKSPNFPAIIHQSETDYHIYCEFQRISGRFHPVIWGKFKISLDTELQVELKQRFAGKFVYVKLIKPVNCQGEMQDMREKANIDCKFVGVRGSVEKMGPE